MAKSERQKAIAALRERDARLATEWEADKDYAEALKEAEKGDPTRLINRLYAKRILTDSDYGALARHIARGKKQSRRGAPGDPAMRECARWADWFLSGNPPLPPRLNMPAATRGEIIEYAAAAYEWVTGIAIDPARLLEWMNHSRKLGRRQK
jgi:hypothetical protein